MLSYQASPLRNLNIINHNKKIKPVLTNLNKKSYIVIMRTEKDTSIYTVAEGAKKAELTYSCFRNRMIRMKIKRPLNDEKVRAIKEDFIDVRGLTKEEKQKVYR